MNFLTNLIVKESKPVNLKGNQPWILMGRNDAEAEVPILCVSENNTHHSSLDVKSWLIGKDLDAEKGWEQEEKRVSEDEMVGWHHWFNGHELGKTPGDSEGRGSLACCSPWGCKQWDSTWWLNSNYSKICWVMVGLLVFCSCYNKLPQISDLKQLTFIML